MLHIATVHWRSEKWIDIQLRFLRRHLTCPYRVYAFLNEIPAANRGKFFYSSVEPIREHAVKLNALADVIAFLSTLTITMSSIFIFQASGLVCLRVVT